jgi:hypothetical protein
MSRYTAPVCRSAIGLFLVCQLIPLAPVQAQSAARRHCYADRPIRDWTDLSVIRSCSEDREYFTTTVTRATGKVFVLVPGLPDYMRLFEDPKNKIDSQLDPSQLILYVDGRPLPRFFGRLPDAKHSHMTFDLGELAYRGVHPDSAGAWKVLLSDGVRDRQMTLSVGFATRGPLPSDVTDFEIDAISTLWLTIWFVLAIVLLGLLLIAGLKSDMLRVPGAPPPAVPPSTVPPRKAYSLARVQMAAWFFAVLLAFVFIYLVTGALDSLTPTVLGLIGISAATGFAATVVDNPGAAPGAVAPASQGFVKDVLQEGVGMSLPRLQMAVWTIVLIFIFARAIYHTLVMPDFNPTLLGLMGISGGTYVGFKLPDGKP